MVSLIYFFPQFALSGIWQLRILALFGIYFILYAVAGLFRGEIFITLMGLAKKSENPLLFWYGIILYLVLGTVITSIIFIISTKLGPAVLKN